MNEVLAPAKLTLSLHVLGRRDDGFHDLDALTVSIDEPHDWLAIQDADSGVTLAVRGPAARGVPVDGTNLAARAAELVRREAGTTAGAAISWAKEIPSGAGLGGGSSDAAAVLRVLGGAWDVDGERLAELAAELGSDVPACLAGGAVWMRGRGEVIEPVVIEEILRVVVVVPPFSCSTPAVYRAWDELGGPRSERVVPAPYGTSHHLAELRNDLEPAAEQVEPGLTAFRTAIESVAGQPAMLAGSGSAYFFCVEDPVRWRALPGLLTDSVDSTAWAGATLDRPR
jgi:4-diphosphocytidyl-2-C-methyl-D-erythritol kinase